MATIRRREGKRGITYDAQIRIRPYPPHQSFKNLTDAKRWIEKTEMEMREGIFDSKCYFILSIAIEDKSS